MAAIIKAVDDYQDLIRLSISYPGNDHRLGSGEAPPAVISIFVGEELEAIIKSIVDGKSYKGEKAPVMDLGVPMIPTFRKDTTDRNRTSPFAFTGNKFEFRMVGSSQNVSMPNIVLNTAVAESFRQFADALDGAEDLDAAIAELLRNTFKEHSRILFDGNGYSDEWEKEAESRGLLNLKRSVDAYKRFSLPKNVELFKTHGVMNENEIKSREEILFETYSKIINIESRTMIEMISRDVIPSVNAYISELADAAGAKMAVLAGVDCSVEKELISTLSDLNAKTFKALDVLRREESAAAKTEDVVERAEAYCYKVLDAMASLRESVDAMEELTSSDYWPYPTYGDMLFKL